jgi:flagellar hook-basal body complex protein FliE
MMYFRLRGNDEEKMDAGKAAAINAYRNQLRMLEQAKEGMPTQETSAGPSFADMLGDAIKDSTATLRQTDALQMESVTGKVDLTDLVTAVSSAELTLNTVVTVRDRVIGAYQDILRMSI